MPESKSEKRDDRVSDPMNIESKCRIIVELWDSPEDQKGLAELIKYGNKIDIYNTALVIAEEVRMPDEESESAVNDFWTRLLNQLSLDSSIDYADLADVLSEASRLK